MSAIGGIFWFHGAPAQPDAIGKLIGVQSSWGPDGCTTWVSGSIALGHCMLRATPEAIDESMPLHSADGQCCLVWDGRLDNRAELRRALPAGLQVRDNTDAELVMQAYLAWGADCATHLTGDFAFAVWDARRNSLLCVRDHTGARPLYWARTDRFFAFASHEEALIGLEGVTSTLYEEGVARLFMPGICVDEDPSTNLSRTWYENVRHMLAGERAQVAAVGELALHRYWKPEPGDQAGYRSDAECEEAFLSVFGQATRDRLRATGEIAVLMSGGLDTAGIVAMTRRILGEGHKTRLHAFAAISDDGDACVETRAILSMAQGMGEQFHSISVPSFRGVAGVKELLAEAWPHSHPEDNAIWLQALLCEAARDKGHRVILQGAHGDLANWAPIRYIAQFLRAGQWRTAWSECVGASHHHNFLRNKSAGRLWAENLWTAWAPASVKYAWNVARGRGPGLRLLNQEFARSLGWRPDRRPSTRLQDHVFVPVDALHGRSLRGLSDSRSAMPRVAGRFGVEARDPWEDRRVVEFFLHLPMQFRIRNGWTKHLVRSAFRHDLDAAVLLRVGKQHLGWEFCAAVVRETHPLLAAALHNQAAPCWKYLDREAAQSTYNTYVSTRDARAAQDVFDLMTFITWSARML